MTQASVFPRSGGLSLRRLLVVRMHLHGERLLTIEEFEQQRKLRLRIVPAEEGGAVLRYQLVQRRAGERPVGDDALVVAVIDDFPTLRVVIAVADRLAQVRCPAAGRPTSTRAGSVEIAMAEVRHDE